MVMVSQATKKQQPSKQRAQILAIAAVVLLAAGSVWVFVSSLSSRTANTKSRASLLKGVRDAGNELRGRERLMRRTDRYQIHSSSTNNGEMKISAKQIMTTGRPYLLYGTAWKEENTASLVTQAIHAGFRFIDTACQPKHYNEAGVGKGWTTAASQLGLERSDFFLQTKFTSINGQDPENIPYDKTAPLEEQVKQSLEASLRNLRTDYIDSLVLHSPMETMEDTLRVWKVFESFVTDGKVRQIGISNCYNFRDLRKLYQEATIKPAVVQNRFHDKTKYDVQLREICNLYGIKYQSFWTLTAPSNRRAMANDDWKEMAREKGLTPQTLMYAFMMALGHTPLDGSSDVNHMKEDVKLMMRFQAGEEVVDKKEIKTLSSLLGIRD
ncbi:hypothetical protein ACHAW6_007654 [Cyclotella cf. meneghiniana]